MFWINTTNKTIMQARLYDGSSVSTLVNKTSSENRGKKSILLLLLLLL